MSESRFGLSKSRITAFEQCPKRLWLTVHRRDLGESDAGAAARFAQGHEVGAIACSLLPDGVMIEPDGGLPAALDMTREHLGSGEDRPLFEATLEHDGVLVRIDILEPEGEGRWRLAEVKSSASAKPYHLRDLATQLWVAREAGVEIGSAVIRHIDARFVLEREGDYRGLFRDADVLEAVEPVVVERPALVAAARTILAGPEPEIAPGGHCSAPFPCEFAGYCTQNLAEGPEWPVTVLPNGGGRRWLEAGVDDLLRVDPDALTSEAHRRVYRATVSGRIDHDAAGAAGVMASWTFPRTWLDFETIGFAVPRWVGARPFQPIPFQFSAQVEAESGSVEHHGFLSLDGGDPRRACAEALVSAVPDTGAVIAYSASFERSRILELAGTFPDLAPPLRSMAERIVDLLPVARAHWYHRDQRGSWSIKAVLPTIAPELDYAGLEVGDGNAAQAAYTEAIAPETAPERRDAIRKALEIYCARDTEAMMVLARRLTTSGADQDGPDGAPGSPVRPRGRARGRRPSGGP